MRIALTRAFADAYLIASICFVEDELGEPGLRYAFSRKRIGLVTADRNRTVPWPADYRISKRREDILSVCGVSQIGRAHATLKLPVMLISHAQLANMHRQLGNRSVPRQGAAVLEHFRYFDQHGITVTTVQKHGINH